MALAEEEQVVYAEQQRVSGRCVGPMWLWSKNGIWRHFIMASSEAWESVRDSEAQLHAQLNTRNARLLSRARGRYHIALFLGAAIFLMAYLFGRETATVVFMFFYLGWFWTFTVYGDVHRRTKAVLEMLDATNQRLEVLEKLAYGAERAAPDQRLGAH